MFIIIIGSNMIVDVEVKLLCDLLFTHAYYTK